MAYKRHSHPDPFALLIIVVVVGLSTTLVYQFTVSQWKRPPSIAAQFIPTWALEYSRRARPPPSEWRHQAALSAQQFP